MKQIKYREGYLYQLAETYYDHLPICPGCDISTEYIKLSAAGDFTVHAGYAWDGPSGPAMDTPTAMRGSLIHDCLYQLIRLGLLGKQWRVKADMIYEEACIKDGMWKIRAWGHFKALRAFGWRAADADSEPPTLIAP